MNKVSIAFLIFFVIPDLIGNPIVFFNFNSYIEIKNED